MKVFCVIDFINSSWFLTLLHIYIYVCVCVCVCSSQSRADLLTLGLAVTNILAGLVWLSIRPKTISMVRVVFVLIPFQYEIIGFDNSFTVPCL